VRGLGNGEDPAHMGSRSTAPRRYRKDSVRTFDELLDLHGAEIYRYALRLTGDRDDADDLYQDTFLAAFRAFGRLRDDNARAWLYRIATNKAIDRRRRQTRTVRLDDLRVVVAMRDGAALADLETAVRALPAGERAAFVLRRLEDLPYAEVAKALGCSEEAARKRVSEATRKVKEAMR
jgi:RNA polymerase sigma-70 factor (ECF subfamily)